ncbi:MAG: hypothetical protein LUF04_14825 [Bacteroides sp.]|nr:hypothetical protein [Bacteroides sp.]
MTSITNEQALEAAIEKALTGHCREEWDPTEENDSIAQDRSEPLYRTGNGFYIGYPEDFDKKYAIDTVRFWSFLENSQPDELNKLRRYSDWKLRILERLDRTLRTYGLLRVLRKGIDVDDAHFTLFYQLPLASSGDTVKANFGKNQFSETRQLRYSQAQPGQEIDMVLFVNGLPLATLELKNAWTGQTARAHGQRQYKTDRDITQPLLQFGRCLVHFAADTDEVYMTTRLNGKDTFFLPFNKGNNYGKGNPPNPQGGHRTAYLWQEILTRQSLANIIQHFVWFSGKEKDKLETRILYFPRYHQLDVVRRLMADVEERGAGHTYLIQHSAGSGKHSMTDPCLDSSSAVSDLTG